VPLGVTLVHPQQVAGEQRGLLAALARLDLEDGVLVVVRILGQQQNFEFLLDARHALFQLEKLLFGHGTQFRIAVLHHRFGIGNTVRNLLVLAIFLDYGGDFGVSLGSLLVFRRVVDNFR